MEVLLYLVPLAIALGGLGLAAFLWSLRNGQYDDLDGAAWRAIADDEPAETSSPRRTRRAPSTVNAIETRAKAISSVDQDACAADRAGFDKPEDRHRSGIARPAINIS